MPPDRLHEAALASGIVATKTMMSTVTQPSMHGAVERVDYCTERKPWLERTREMASTSSGKVATEGQPDLSPLAICSATDELKLELGAAHRSFGSAVVDSRTESTSGLFLADDDRIKNTPPDVSTTPSRYYRPTPAKQQSRRTRDEPAVQPSRPENPREEPILTPPPPTGRSKQELISKGTESCNPGHKVARSKIVVSSAETKLPMNTEQQQYESLGRRRHRERLTLQGALSSKKAPAAPECVAETPRHQSTDVRGLEPPKSMIPEMSEQIHRSKHRSSESLVNKTGPQTQSHCAPCLTPSNGNEDDDDEATGMLPRRSSRAETQESPSCPPPEVTQQLLASTENTGILVGAVRNSSDIESSLTRRVRHQRPGNGKVVTSDRDNDDSIAQTDNRLTSQLPHPSTLLDSNISRQHLRSPRSSGFDAAPALVGLVAVPPNNGPVARRQKNSTLSSVLSNTRHLTDCESSGASPTRAPSSHSIRLPSLLHNDGRPAHGSIVTKLDGDDADSAGVSSRGQAMDDRSRSSSSSDWSCQNDVPKPNATSPLGAESFPTSSSAAVPCPSRWTLDGEPELPSEMAAGFAPSAFHLAGEGNGRLARSLGASNVATAPSVGFTSYPSAHDDDGPSASVAQATGDDVELPFLVGSAADTAFRAREQLPATQTMESTCERAGRVIRVTQKQLRIVGGYRIQTRVEVVDLRLPRFPVIFSVKHSHGYPWGRQLTVQKNILLACIIAGGAEPPVEISPDARTMFCRTGSSQHLHSYIERVIPHVRRCEGTPAGVRLFWWRAVLHGAIVLLNETTGRMIFVLNRERSLPSAATTLARALAVLRQLVLDNLQLSALAAELPRVDGSAAIESNDPGLLPPSFLLLDPTYPSASDVESLLPKGDNHRPISLDQVRNVVHQWALQHEVSPWLTKLILRIRGPRKNQISNYRYSLDVDSSDPCSLALQAHLNEPLSREMQAFPVCMVPIALRGRSLGEVSLTFLQALWFLKKLFDFHRTTVAATASVPNRAASPTRLPLSAVAPPHQWRQLLPPNPTAQRRLYSASSTPPDPAASWRPRVYSGTAHDPAAFRAPRLGICVEPPRLMPPTKATVGAQSRITSRDW